MRLALILLFMVSMTMAMNLKRSRYYDDSEDYNEVLIVYSNTFFDVVKNGGLLYFDCPQIWMCPLGFMLPI